MINPDEVLEQFDNLLRFLCQERTMVGTHSVELIELTDLAMAARNMLDGKYGTFTYQAPMMAQYRKDREKAVAAMKDGDDLADTILHIRKIRKQREKAGIKDN